MAACIMVFIHTKFYENLSFYSEVCEEGIGHIDIMITHAHPSVWNDSRISMVFVFYEITKYVLKQLLSSIQSWALCCSVSTTGMLAGIKMSHAAVTSLCRSMKLACELYPSRHIALCLDPYCGLGFALWCLSRWVGLSTYCARVKCLYPLASLWRL